MIDDTETIEYIEVHRQEDGPPDWALQIGFTGGDTFYGNIVEMERADDRETINLELSQIVGITRDKDSGRTQGPSVTDDQIIRFVEEMDRAVATSEVADVVDKKRSTVYARLKSFEDEGRLQSQMIAGSRFWEPDNQEGE